MQSFGLRLGNAMRHARGAWEDGDGESLDPKEGAPPPWAPLASCLCPLATPAPSARTLPPVTQWGPRRALGTLVHPTEASGPWLHPLHPASSVEPGGTLSARPRGRLGTPVPGSGRLRAAPVTDHGTQPSDYGAQMRTACIAGPAGLQQGRGRPSLPGPWGARQPEGAVDREQELSWPQSFLPAATQGRALGSGGGLSWGGDGSAWGSACTRTLARPAGVSPALRTESHPGRAESESLGQRPATGSCRHSQAGGQEETRSGPWKPATGKEGKEPKLVECLLHPGHTRPTGNVTPQGRGAGALPVSKMDRDKEDSVVATQATGGTARVLIRCSIIHTHNLPYRDARAASSHQHPPLHPDPGAQQHTAWGFSEATSWKRQCAG